MKHRTDVLFLVLTLGFGAILVLASCALPFFYMGSLDFIVSLTAGLALTTLVALFITGWMLRDRFRESQGNEADPILARISHGNVRREAFRVNELLAFTALIVTVILGIETVASGRLLILIVLLYLTANSILDRLEYTATYQMIREKLHSGEVSK